MSFIRPYILLLLSAALPLVLSTSGARPAHAQACGVTPEIIVTLRKYSQGNYSVWDYVYGVRKMERLTDALELPDRSIVAVGYTFPKGRERDVRPLMFRIDRRERMLWENRFENSRDRITPKAVRAIDDETFLVVGDIASPKEGNRIWAGFFGLDGEPKDTRIVEDSEYDLFFEDMTESIEEDGFVLAVRARHKKFRAREHGVVYGLTKEAKYRWKRSYKPGLDNRLYGITTVRDEAGLPYYIAVGSLDMDAQRRAGFIMAIDRQGRMAWGEQYPRGLNANFREVAAVTDGDVVVIGDIVPQDGPYKQSAWIMRLESESGDPQWERYVAIEDMRVYGRKIFGYPDGRIVAAVDTDNEEGGELPELARVLSMSPRGVIFQDDPFLEGKSVRVNEMHSNSRGHRFLIGSAEESYKADDVDDVDNYKTDDGWMIFAPALDPYDDPCIPRRYYNQ